ncbi:PREDICTED: probable ADP-ribosylation factor GTPase-activating protein AGD11 [Nelumbo nucifera]|uniref:Probable ADP-ribosylation factor GTPase-activating protein AGD11 n=1 Tax=Nelumbo nucifera TaxID=4432 RepID=A0A1U7ZH03_NELNU|nr:PREDICTED: probable ADP-ribosylation factor GTPase-activating protein AGD11 [Nelumbo nucifera]
MSGPLERLEDLMNQPGNKICADCGTPDPKWVSSNLGVFICIKCSGVHRSLGVHISKVVSVKLDEWTDEEVDSLVNLGGNTRVNMKYENSIPDYVKKPKPDSSIEERSDFIRRKYELQQFLDPPNSSSHSISSSVNAIVPYEKKNFEKQVASIRFNAIGHAFRNSWRRKESEHKPTKKSNSEPGMVEFVGLIKVNVVKGTNLAIRDVVSSDPYVILSLGQQSMKTRVIKNNLNPVWNERILLSIPEPVPPLKVQVFDKDTFSQDDHMGEAEIDIQPLLSAAKSCESSTNKSSIELGKLAATQDSTLLKDSIITVEDGKVKQVVAVRLQNVERGVIEIELECVPLSQ